MANFSQPCCVQIKKKDIPCMFTELKTIGYTPYIEKDIDFLEEEEIIQLTTYPYFKSNWKEFSPIALFQISDVDNESYFNCYDNKDIFLKIANMRSDTDKNQYFVDEEGAYLVNLNMKIEPNSLEKCLVDKQPKAFNSPKRHRASASEIYNWFKEHKDEKEF